jgi:hypothetical protein
VANDKDRDKHIETVVLNDPDDEAETVVLDEDLVREITGDDALAKHKAERASRIVRLGADAEEDADPSGEASS